MENVEPSKKGVQRVAEKRFPKEYSDTATIQDMSDQLGSTTPLAESLTYHAD